MVAVWVGGKKISCSGAKFSNIMEALNLNSFLLLYSGKYFTIYFIIIWKFVNLMKYNKRGRLKLNYSYSNKKFSCSGAGASGLHTV